MGLTILPVRTAKISPVQKLSWSDITLDKVRGLDTTKHDMVILTPVVPPLEPPRRNANGQLEATDPFECLGRALEKHHPRIRHVPYWPQSGITPYHYQWIQHAKAIVFVVSEPVGRPNSASQGSMWNQSQAAITTIAEFRDRPDNLVNSAAVLLLCGNNVRTDIDDYGVVMHCCDYSPRNLEEAVRVLYSD